MKHTILVVDDETDNVDALERLFRKKYQVLKGTSAAEGLALLKGQKVALIISDQRMPGKTGVEFLKQSMSTHPDTIRILLTGYTDIESVIDAINSGEVYRYISKPWDPVDLANTVDKAIEKYDLTAELAEKNRQLTAALNELKVLDEAKNKFMILINHELKTPLTVILSFCELLKESELDEEQKLFLNRIVQSSDRLKRLIDDSLLFVSAETNTLKLSKKKISLKDLAKDLSEKYSETAKQKGQVLKLKMDSITLKADPKVLEEVMGRLLQNALRHGQKNSEIKISAKEKKNGDHDGWSFLVENEGKAISKKIIDALHRPFNLDEDIMKHSDGLGLGLSLSQALLKAHGSQLEIESDKGQVRVGFHLQE